ncbi:MAG: hypothetical protein R3362_06270, partial [Rhodothermales bacterium]|nr:hypothetical protein [Rhodothermales bacterium]
MRPFLLALLLLASLPAAVLAQEAPLPFEIEIEEVAWPDPAAIPALHSFAWAEHDGKWLLVAGRTDGLHGFGADPFPVASANDAVWVVDPAAGTAWSQPLDGLSTPLRESLMVTNAQYHQEGETLYLIGGYGHSTEAGTMITFPTLTAIDVPELIAAVTGGTDLGPHFRQIEDERMAVTGGELRKLPLFGQYLLIGGQRFDGEYSGPGSEFEQEYLTSIRAFDIDDGAGLAVIGWAEFFTDPDGLHRRDLTVAPVAWPDASVGTAHGFGIYGGVFRPAQDLPILEPAFVYHTDVPEYALADGFEQQLNHYTCPAVALVDPATARTFTTFFGGMGLYYEDDDTGEVVADPRVPFIREVSTLTTEQATPIAETLQPFEMPGFLGTNAAFIPATDVPQYENGAFKLDELPAEWVTVGTIYGGLEA